MQLPQGLLRYRSVLPLLVLAMLGTVSAAQAASKPVTQGAPFRIDDGSSTYVLDATVAQAPDDSLAVVYQPDNTSGSLPLMARRIDAGGAPLTAPLQVTQDGSGEYYPAYVAINAAGNFVVLWGNRSGLFARAFASNGAPLSNQFQVDDSANPLTAQFPNTSADTPDYGVAIDDSNRIITAWTVGDGDGKFVPGRIGTYTKVVGRRFTTAGAPIDAAPFTISGSSGLPVRTSVAVAASGAGQFVIGWIGTYEYNLATGIGEMEVPLTAAQIQFQRYSAAGVAQGAIGGPGSVVSHQNANQFATLSAAMNRSGQIALTWTGLGDQHLIYTQRFTAGGLPASGRLSFPFNNPATVPQDSAIGIDAAGDCVTVWPDAVTVDASSPLLDALSGTAPGGAFTAQAWGYGQPAALSIGMGPTGHFTVVYLGVSPANTLNSVYGQRYALQ